MHDLLTFQAGHGMPDTLDAPILDVLVEQLSEGPPRPHRRPAPDEWMSRLAKVPMVHQPGEGWTYNLGYEILGILLARAGGGSLTDVLTDTILGPIGMDDTGFSTDRTDRMPSYYIRGESGLELVDPPEGQWSRPPPFESGGGGLVSTIDDWHAFGRMLLAGGLHGGHAGHLAGVGRGDDDASTSTADRTTRSSTARRGASAARWTSGRPNRGTSSAGTAGPARPARRAT